PCRGQWGLPTRKLRHVHPQQGTAPHHGEGGPVVECLGAEWQYRYERSRRATVGLGEHLLPPVTGVGPTHPGGPGDPDLCGAGTDAAAAPPRRLQQVDDGHCTTPSNAGDPFLKTPVPPRRSEPVTEYHREVGAAAPGFS